MNLLAKFFKRSSTEQCLMIEAVLLTGIARLAVLTIPFRWIARGLGKHMACSPRQGSPQFNSPLVDQIRSAVETVSRHVPWKSNCLAQAVAAACMLRIRRQVGTIYFGVKKDDEGGIKAHAWLRSGEIIVTGADGMKDFTVLSTFAFPFKS